MGLAGVTLASEKVSVSGIGALRFVVGPDAGDEPHRSWADIQRLLEQAELSVGARRRAQDIFRRLAQAEATVHGVDPAQVHFHEVGAVDSIADIVGAALALDYFQADHISCAPILVGRGVVKCQHGFLPVPAPATAELLKALPSRGLDIEAELTTPTGAAIMAAQVDQCTPWPEMELEAIGYGAGTKSLPGRPNVLRVLLGQQTSVPGDEMVVEANIDDMSPEIYDHLLSRLFAQGAHDAWLTPIIMKKSRPAVTLTVLCHEAKLETLERIIFEETTTIGLRRHPVTRRKLPRKHETVSTAYGQVRIKIAGEGGEPWTVSPEHDDCRRCAEQKKVPLKEVYHAAMAAWRGRKP